MNIVPLAPGTLLAPDGVTATTNHYRIVRVLGTGGFGITYLAEWMGAQVAVKEYLPREFAVRAQAGSGVEPRAGEQAELFRFGLERFEEEARTLMQLKDAPSIARVLNYFEANGTAYLVMDYAVGPTLEEVVRERGALPEQALGKILVLMLQSLAIVHQRGYLHRDIKPTNIIVLPDGRPLLIDFGAARQALGARTQMLTVMLSPGFAPFEQYNTSGSGPFTDLYSLGATLYYCSLTIEQREVASIMSRAQAPDRVAALQRGEPDPLLPAAQLGAGRYSAGLLAVLDSMLKIWPNERPQTATEALARLKGPVTIEAPVIAGQRPDARPDAAAPSPPSRAKARPRLWLGATAVAAISIALAGRQPGDGEGTTAVGSIVAPVVEPDVSEASTNIEESPASEPTTPPPVLETAAAAIDPTPDAPPDTAEVALAVTNETAAEAAPGMQPRTEQSMPAAGTVAVTLPAVPGLITNDELRAMLVEYDLFDARRNPSGKGITHRYSQQTIGSAAVIIDATTGLMWQKAASASDQNTYLTLGLFIEQLNRERFAGFDDWRVPTVLEALSLMEPAAANAKPMEKALHDPLFTGGNFIWSADKTAEDRAWLIYFYDGTAASERLAFTASVRAVRTLQQSRE